MNTVKSEWTKLVTTKAFLWTTVLYVFFALGMAAIAGWMVTESEMGIPLLTADSALLGISGLGFYVVIIQAVMVVTSEYRFNVQSATFIATPRRTTVAVAKAGLYSAYVAVLTAIVTLACYYVAKLTASDLASATLDVWGNPVAKEFMWLMPAAAVMLTLFSQGIAWLLRQTAGVISIMLVWYTALEGLLALIPKIGHYFREFGPMSNLMAFVSRQDIQDAPWGYQGSGLYFLAWALIIFILGVVVLNKRDA